jgi:hypothetical protein
VFNNSVVVTVCCSDSERTMRKGAVSYLQQITCSQLSLSEKSDVKVMAILVWTYKELRYRRVGKALTKKF